MLSHHNHNKSCWYNNTAQAAATFHNNPTTTATTTHRIRANIPRPHGHGVPLFDFEAWPARRFAGGFAGCWFGLSAIEKISRNKKQSVRYRIHRHAQVHEGCRMTGGGDEHRGDRPDGSGFRRWRTAPPQNPRRLARAAIHQAVRKCCSQPLPYLLLLRRRIRHFNVFGFSFGSHGAIQSQSINERCFSRLSMKARAALASEFFLRRVCRKQEERNGYRIFVLDFLGVQDASLNPSAATRWLALYHGCSRL